MGFHPEKAEARADWRSCRVWLFVALAASQKAVLSYLVGKRTTENTYALANDPRARIVNRPQITSDGYAP